MFNRSLLADFRFPAGFQTNLDWMAWLELARRPGGFVYVRERLVSKGVHEGSETTATIANRAREREDREILTRCGRGRLPPDSRISIDSDIAPIVFRRLRRRETNKALPA